MKQLNSPRKSIKTVLFDIIVKLIIIAGIGLLLYPTISNKWNESHQTKIIEGYAHAVENFTEQDYSDLLTTAQEYNEYLTKLPDRFKPNEEQLEEYNKTLNITGDGLMAYVEIPKLSIKLPIYHSVNEAILQVAAGHIPGSSLPIGGHGTHCAISGHTGLTSATLFTHLNDMELGDMFYIKTLDMILAYQVDQIDIVLPDEFDLLQIDKEQDYCTLITCTPYGVNSHRLLVRGTRVEYTPDEEQEIEPIAPKTPVAKMDNTFFYIGIFATIIVIILIIRKIFTKKKPRGKRVAPHTRLKARKGRRLKKHGDKKT